MLCKLSCKVCVPVSYTVSLFLLKKNTTGLLHDHRPSEGHGQARSKVEVTTTIQMGSI